MAMINLDRTSNYSGIATRELKRPSWVAISKSRRRIPVAKKDNNTKQFPIVHGYKINCVILARQEMDTHDGYHIAFTGYISLMTIPA